MRWTFFYLGMALLVFGIISAFASVNSISTSQFASPLSKHIVIAPGATGYIPVVLNESGTVLYSFNSSSALDFYFVNSSVFGSEDISNANGSRLGGALQKLEGAGVYEVYKNATSGVFPYVNYTSAFHAKPDYSYNFTTIMQQDTYYGVFVNTGNKQATVSSTLLTLPLSGVKSAQYPTMVYGGASFILLLAGIVLMIISIFMQGKPGAEQTAMDEAAKKAYAKLKKASKKK